MLPARFVAAPREMGKRASASNAGTRCSYESHLLPWLRWQSRKVPDTPPQPLSFYFGLQNSPLLPDEPCQPSGFRWWAHPPAPLLPWRGPGRRCPQRQP